MSTRHIGYNPGYQTAPQPRVYPVVPTPVVHDSINGCCDTCCSGSSGSSDKGGCCGSHMSGKALVVVLISGFTCAGTATAASDTAGPVHIAMTVLAVVSGITSFASCFPCWCIDNCKSDIDPSDDCIV